MARNKQTARYSTGGKAPRKTLATKAACHAPSVPEKLIISGTDAGRDFEHITYVRTTGCGRTLFYVLRRDARGRAHSEEITASGDVVKECFGEAVFDWCRKRRGVKLDVATAYRWGWTEAVLLEEAGTTEKENGVDMFVSRDKVFYNPLVRTEGLSLPHGLRYRDLKPGCYHGAQLRSTDWHLVLLHTSRVRISPAEIAVKGVNDRGARILKLGTTTPMHKRLDGFEEQCISSPGEVFLTEGPGWRPKSTHANRYYCQKKRILVNSDGEECAISAVSNAIFASGDEGLAQRAASISWRPSIRGLRDLSKWEVRTYHLEAYKIRESIVSVDWVVNHCRDIIVLHIVGSNDLNHMVCVDGPSGLIYDSLERRPMRLSKEALKCCVGDGSEILEAKARKFVKHSSAQRIGEPRRLSKKQKKRRVAREKKAELEKKAAKGSNKT